MRLLVDEGVPVQVVPALSRNKGHQFQHIDELSWKSKDDAFVFRDAARQGFDVVLALDVGQLTERSVCKALKDSGLHHISLRQGRTVKGDKGTARVIASIVCRDPLCPRRPYGPL